ncbi:MAG: HD domain-containing protein [Bryobacteraceae bacterium]|nr:HD domain-containing protein [Bryobacteraceae bacterium]
MHWRSHDAGRFLVYLVIALLASGTKVALPAVNGTMSANFLFVLIGIAAFSLPETLVMGCLGILVQSVWQARKRPNPLRLAFNTASIALAASAAYRIYHLQWFAEQSVERPVVLLCAATAFFIANTLFVACAIAATERQPLWPLWRDGYFWSFPFYLVGAVVAALIEGVGQWIGWQTALLILPVLYVIHNAHKLHVEKLEAASEHAKRERQHALDKAAIQLRTIEALALAIEAKDGTTYEHLERVQVYALGVGRELGLNENEMEALRAAATLHDVGKIAVPEYIISKPGKLSPAEFEKMKIHPIVGAQILEQVQFPYPVAPIVRSHHEKWDGTGYPDGLRGEEIPIGARILTAVDVLDALASDRQYRKAMPLPEAMAILERDAGRMFDPKVVEVLSRRYVELEKIARQKILDSRPIIQTDVKVERGAAPDAGFESASSPAAADLSRLHGSITGSDRKRYRLEGCGSFVRRVEPLIAFDALGVFVEEGETLRNIFSEGNSAGAIQNLDIPLGKGLVGWVAENHMPIINGNPAVEPGLADRIEGRALSSALAVPVESVSGGMIVVCLYRRDRDAFNRDHLKAFQALSAGIHEHVLVEALS